MFLVTWVQQRLFHPHDTQWPMPNEAWVCCLGLCFSGGMFLFQHFARTAKTGSGLLSGKWRNLGHTVALSQSHHSNNSLQSEVSHWLGLWWFTRLSESWSALKGSTAAHFQHHGNASFPFTTLQTHQFWITCSREIALKWAHMHTERGEAQCRNAELQNFSSREENNSLEALKENEKAGVTLDQRLRVLQSALVEVAWWVKVTRDWFATEFGREWTLHKTQLLWLCCWHTAEVAQYRFSTP